MSFGMRIRQIRFFNLLMLTLAGVINAIGVVLFLSPVKLFDSGIDRKSVV